MPGPAYRGGPGADRRPGTGSGAARDVPSQVMTSHLDRVRLPGHARVVRACWAAAGGLRWVVRHRAWTPYHLRRYARFLLFKLRNPRVVTEGLVFLGRDVQVTVGPGRGRLILGRWVHLGDGTRIRAHEGTVRIDDKCVLGSGVTINSYLDVEIGSSCLIADWGYITDFDHVTEDLQRPIKDQGLVKSPVRIGRDCWLGARVSVLRGSDIGQGVVAAAHCVVRGQVPDHAIVAGVPARVVKDRRAVAEAASGRRAYLEGLARGDARAAHEARTGP